jgi:hypothetical protein
MEGVEMRRFSLLSAIPAVALIFAGSIGASAQDTEDERTNQLSPDLCVVEPRAAEDLIAAFGLEAASVDEAPAFEPAEIVVPLGDPAAGDIIAGVTATTEEFFACTNAGDVPRLTALLTDAGVYRFYGFGPREEDTEAQLRAWAEGETNPREEDSFVRLIAVTDVSVMADGRVAAFVVNNEPLLPPRGPETLLFVYSLADDGTWLIDDYYDFTIIAPEDEGTE